MSFLTSDQNPEPSKGRAVLSLLAGMALLGSGSAAGIGTGLRDNRQKRPVYTRSDHITMTVGMLLFYAAIGLGITIGWRQTHSFWGPWVGGLLGVPTGLVLNFAVLGLASLVGRAQRRA